MAIIKLSAIERRRVSAFFTCLALAIIAWLFTVLSNPHKYPVKEVLTFKNAPQKRAFHSLQSDTISVTVNGTGWDVLFSRMHTENKPLTVDLRSLEYKNYVVLSAQIDQINAKKEISQQITSFNPDTLYFDFSNRREKRIPVQLITSINYKHQFAQSNNLTIKPGYVIINGPANVIDKIAGWKTDTLKVDSVSETVKAQLNLAPVFEGNLSIYPKSVQVTVPVEEFTEKTIEIPVKIINNHDYGDVKIFPQKVKLTFTVPLSRYAEIDEDFFEVIADLDLWHNRGYKVLPVVVTKIPPWCRIVKTQPKDIDFIIKK